VCTVLTKVNHSCAPNCVKFCPTAASCGASEIWSVREIAENEEITICYCERDDMIYSSRDEFLQSHHRFQCACPWCQSSRCFEDGKAIEARDSTREHLLRLEKEIIHMEQELLWQTLDDRLEAAVTCANMVTHAASLLSEMEQQLVVCSEDILMMQVRTLKLIANVAVAGIGALETLGKGNAEALEFLASEFLQSTQKLLVKQLQYLHPDHPVLASTHVDISQALESSGKTARGHTDAAKKIKMLYNTRKRFPRASRELKKAGDCYWGSK
jgi:hypothetical protein